MKFAAKTNRKFKSMQKIGFFSAACLLASLALLGFKADFSLAQNPTEKIGLAVDRSVFAFDLEPGAEKIFTLKVKNIAEVEERLSTETQDFIIGEQNEIIFLSDKNEINGLGDWLKVDVANWFLAPGEEREIKVSLIVPPQAVPGSHFSVLALRALPKIDAANFQQSIISGRIAVEILVNVQGQVSGQGRLVSFQAPILATKEINFKAEFQNEGTAHYIPYGEVQIKDLLFRRENKIAMPRHFVFPGKKYTFENNWPADTSLGIYLAKASFVDGEKITHSAYRIIFGRYFFLTLVFILGIIFGLFKLSRRLRKTNALSNNQN